MSENIEVRSIVDRFLEHSRIFCFAIGSECRMFLGSSDWLKRSMDRRIELIFLIEDPDLKKRLHDEVLEVYWQDNVKARRLNSDGSYSQVKPRKGEASLRAQNHLIELARVGGLKSIPYERAIRKSGLKRNRFFLHSKK